MKKKIYFGFALIIAAVFTVYTSSRSEAVVAEEKPAVIKWYDIETAEKLSDSIPKRIFIDFSTSWCGWCKKMDAETFANPTIAKYMNENYYCVKFDAESRDTIVFNGQTFVNRGAAGQRSAHDFAITVLHGQLSYPSYAIFNKAQTHISIMMGYMTPEQFEPYLHFYAEEKETTMTYQDYLKTFKSELPKKEAPPRPIGPQQ